MRANRQVVTISQSQLNRSLQTMTFLFCPVVASKEDQINRAEGEAQAIAARAQATASSIANLSRSICSDAGNEAAALMVAQ